MHRYLLEAPQPDQDLGGNLGPCWGPWHIWLMLQGPSLGKELVWGSPKLPQGLGQPPRPLLLLS